MCASEPTCDGAVVRLTWKKQDEGNDCEASRAPEAECAEIEITLATTVACASAAPARTVLAAPSSLLC